MFHQINYYNAAVLFYLVVFAAPIVVVHTRGLILAIADWFSDKSFDYRVRRYNLWFDKIGRAHV